MTDPSPSHGPDGPIRVTSPPIEAVSRWGSAPGGHRRAARYHGVTWTVDATAIVTSAGSTRIGTHAPLCGGCGTNLTR
jgi:hypothetical protein